MSLYPVYDSQMPRQVSDHEMEICHEAFIELAEMERVRNPYAHQWEQIASLIWPTQSGTFMYGNQVMPGTQRTDKQIDATGMLALHRFGAICDSLSTPRNQLWHGLEASDPYVMKDRATKLWFEEVTRILFRERYSDTANFSAQNQLVYKGIGAFSTSPMFIDTYEGPRGERGLRYCAVPIGEIYIRRNHQGICDGFIRVMRMTARQAEQKWPGMLPSAMISALQSKSEQLFTFLHRVCPRSDYDPGAIDARGLVWKSHYISVEGRCLMQPEKGYNTFPLAVASYEQDFVYGTSPAMMALPALKTLNAEKKMFLKQGHRAGDPVLLTYDDLTLNLRPGAQNPGGMNSDGRPLVGTVPTGEIQITEEMMAVEGKIVNDLFLVTLFQILTESPTMTATEVIERTNEKGILLAPTVGGLQSSYIGPTVHRELDVLSQLRKLPPMPERLKEARGQYAIVHTSPLAKAARAQLAAGFMRTVDKTAEWAGVVGDPSLLDPFNFKVAIPAIADIQSVPESWMASADEMTQKAQSRANQQKIQQEIQAAPAAAAMMKAQKEVQPQGA